MFIAKIKKTCQGLSLKGLAGNYPTDIEMDGDSPKVSLSTVFIFVLLNVLVIGEANRRN